jgi:hypothetical protein
MRPIGISAKILVVACVTKVFELLQRQIKWANQHFQKFYSLRPVA